MDPLEQLFDDRKRARAAEDAFANLCAFATVDREGAPQVRTLVLRDVEERLAVFVNESSPKWKELTRPMVLIFLATLKVQYRMRCGTEPVPEQIVRDSWQLRPEAPKRMDWFYRQRAQSSEIASRELLLDELDTLTPPEPLIAPESAKGLFLVPEEIERLDLNQPNGVHDRRRWVYTDGEWVETVLVP